jgi:hypothetical protein
MKTLKPYWFLESPVDTEHKYYVLMGYLTKIKKSFDKPGFEKGFKELLLLKKDLENFDSNTEFSQKTMANMPDKERDLFYTILDKNLDKIDEIEKIVQKSIKTINDFLDSNKEAYDKYNSLVEIQTHCTRYNLWDQGFLIVRKKDAEFMKVFSWFFSVIKIDQKENIALLMTEMLEPPIQTTLEFDVIKGFLKKNLKDFSDMHDCVLVAEVSPVIDLEIGTEISKEKSIEIILKNYKNS